MTQEIEIIIDEPIVIEMGAQQALPDSVVIDENYVHTDNNYTDAEKDKVANALTSETDPTVPSWAKQPSKPSYNKSEIGLGNVDNTSDADKPVSSATQNALNLKADKTYVDSELDLKADTNSLSDVATSGNYNDLTNKPTLGTASTQDSTAFATAAQGTKADTALQSETDPTVPSHVKAITETDISNWNTPSHSHANKTLLDSYTQTETNLADAVSKKHSHANKTELDSITATKIAEWNAALQAEDLAGLASETYVDAKVAGIVDTAPETLNTLNELAAALGDDPNFATSIATQLGQKANTADLGTAAFTSIENYIKNQTTEDQPAGFRISGNGVINGSLGVGGSPGSVAFYLNKDNSTDTTSGMTSPNSTPMVNDMRGTFTQLANYTNRYAFNNEKYIINGSGFGSSAYIYGNRTNITAEGAGRPAFLWGSDVTVVSQSEQSTENTWLYGFNIATQARDKYRANFITGINSTTLISPLFEGTIVNSNSLIGLNMNSGVDLAFTAPSVTTINVTNITGIVNNVYARGRADNSNRIINVGSMIGIDLSVGATNNPVASIVDAYGIMIRDGSGNNAGAVTNAYGLYITGTSHGDVKNYNIWSGGTGLNYLSGKTGIGVENPVEKLEVNGSILSKIKELSADPTTANIPDGYTMVVRNTTSGVTALWANVAGTLIKTTLS